MNNISLKTLFWVVLLAVIMGACSGQTPSATQPVVTASPEPATGEVSFSAGVLPIFEARCTRCHGTSRQNGGLRLDSYVALLAGGKDGAVVVPGDAAGSTLVRLITEGEMPKNSSPLSAEQITLISEWVTAGALDN